MRISARERRFLLVGGLAVGVYLAAVYVVEPAIVSQLQVREEIRQKADLLERHQLQAAGKDRTVRKVDAVRGRLQQVETLTFKGDRLPLVAAEIQGLLHKLADESAVTILRENVAAPKKAEMFTAVMVELSVRGELRALRDFLYKIQTAPKLLAVPRLAIRGSTSRAQPTLAADLQVASYMTGSPADGAAAATPAKRIAVHAGLENG